MFLILAIAIPLLIVLDSRLRKQVSKRITLPPPKYSNIPLPASVDVMKQETGIAGSPTPTPVAGAASFPEPKLVTIRGFFSSLKDGVLTLNTGTNALSAEVSDDVFTVCTAQTWKDADGNEYDITRTWIDLSQVTIANYNQVGINENLVNFRDYKNVLTSDTHIIVYALESPADRTLVARKLWIVGCK